MANECNGRWLTTLYYDVKDHVNHNPPLKVDDELITIDNEDGQGNVDVIHHKTNPGVKHKGKCQHGPRHVISFDRPEDGNIFKYMDGQVIGDRIRCGTFRVVGPPPPFGAGLPGEGDSGTWESNREGSLGPSEGDEHGQGQGQGFGKGGGGRETY